MTETAPGGTGWGVRPHGSVGPRRLAGIAMLGVTPSASVTLVMAPATRVVIGNAPTPSPGWRLRVREAPPVAPPPPAPAATPAPPAEGHPVARVVVAAVGVTVLATIAAQLRGSAPGQQPTSISRITTVPPHRSAPPVSPLPSPPSGSSTHPYQVVPGDSMSAIAARHGISLTDLARANPQVHDLGLIHVGDLLRIP